MFFSRNLTALTKTKTTLKGTIPLKLLFSCVYVKQTTQYLHWSDLLNTNLQGIKYISGEVQRRRTSYRNKFLFTKESLHYRSDSLNPSLTKEDVFVKFLYVLNPDEHWVILLFMSVPKNSLFLVAFRFIYPSIVTCRRKYELYGRKRYLVFWR